MDDIFILQAQYLNFAEIAKEIYHPSLDLEQTNINPLKTCFLDLDIEIKNNKIDTKLYNKTDDYNFDVIRYSHFKSNIPNIYKTKIISGETLRTARISSSKTNFDDSIENIKTHLTKSRFR